jgi:SAM-dependent methyltransferase
LCADTFFVGTLKGVGKVYLHAVVDTYGSYAFGFLHVSKRPEAAVAVLHNEVLPFYQTLDLPVGAVLTDNGREFCGTDTHPYELYLELNGIEHRKTRIRTPRTNGFVERFNGTVLDEFFRVKMRDTLYETVEALQADLDAWLAYYNTERPHLGYRNQGRDQSKLSIHSLDKKVKRTSNMSSPPRDWSETAIHDSDANRARNLLEWYGNEGWIADEKNIYADTKAFVDIRKIPWQYTSNCVKRLKKYFKDGGRYILDAGSGPIPHNELLEYSSPFSRRVCIDLAVPALCIAKSKLENKGICLQADLINIPIKTGSMDAVTCNHVIYHIPADKQATAFRELWRVLRPGGVGVVVYRWQWSLIESGLEKIGRWLTGDGRSGEVVFPKPDLYYHAHSLRWFRSQKWPFRYRIDTFRIVGNEFMQKYVSDNWLGKGTLQIFFALQQLFPSFCGKYGAYPAIVIFKD